ncbi:replication initiation protein [Leptotrichia sp. oral taxon 417]|uniref:replication initiation protein n=1 Tax=Leptotrichia sp. oral taxon 417 TaxID=712365 RepID=UPI0015C10049|nr:replication initiation protein [Leptotrichia sp. oral taxon 417]NWO28286.1 replication initiation protein [Leptotrichia sp. oral taxon 417]
MNEIVKYHNNFNSVALKNFNGVEIDLLMAICSKLKNEDINEIKLEFSDLRRMVNSKHRGELRFIQNLEQMYKKLLNLSIRIETEDKITNFILFTKYEILKKQKIIIIKINEEFKFLLNKLINNFTRFELNEFISLKSNYSKEIYRRLKQFKHTGIWKIKMNNFRELLNIPEKYRMSEIDKKVLKISMEELNKYFNNFKIIKIKKGRKIEFLEFKFVPEKKYNEKIESSDRELSFPDETKKIETTPKKVLRVVEAFPEVKKEKNLTLKERIEKEIGILKNDIQRNTSLLIGLMEDPKRSLDNPVIMTVRKNLVEKNSKLTKLEEFYSLDDDKIDENMKEKIENLLKSGAES